MAVTTTITSAPQYMRDGDNIPACIGGGNDYRTIGKGTTETEMLFIRGFFGDNISSACKIQSISAHVKFSCSRPNNKEPYSWEHGNARYSVMVGKGSVSGNLFTLESGTWFGAWSPWTGNLSYSWKEWNSSNTDFSSYNQSAKDVYVGMSCELKHDASSNFCVWVGGVSFTVTRTRACYITFKGEGVTEKTVTQDYDTVPSYGSTPTRDGYTFKGWNDGSKTYSGTLPTAYEQDVTYTAVWEKNKYTLTVNAGTGGTVSGGGTYEHGTSVTIGATPNNGYKFVKWSDGDTSATRTITVTGNATYTAVFEEIIVPPEIVSAAITYGGVQVSAQNKVPAGEGFLLAVGLK